VKNVFGKTGFGFLKKYVRAFNHASRINPYLMLTDLDTDECAPLKIHEWLGIPNHPNFIFRVAVREVEAWLLADSTGISRFFGIPVGRIPLDVEILPDPKLALISLARQSKKRDILDDIVPLPGTTSSQGRNYNGRMKIFVQTSWNINAAMIRSTSLSRTFQKLCSFTPIQG
jgi:hypothetical protein